MATEERRWPNAPLRIEVDRFLFWLGETQYSKEEKRLRYEALKAELEKALGL